MPITPHGTETSPVQFQRNNLSCAKSLFRLAFQEFDNPINRLYMEVASTPNDERLTHRRGLGTRCHFFMCHRPPRLNEAATEKALRGPLPGFTASALIHSLCRPLPHLAVRQDLDPLLFLEASDAGVEIVAHAALREAEGQEPRLHRGLRDWLVGRIGDSRHCLDHVASFGPTTA